jgi:transcriptional regulator with XRE-family HTH domain
MERKGLIQAELARRAGTSPETVGNYMHDRVLPDHVKAAQLFAIANAVDLSGHQLLTGQPEPWTADARSIAEPQASYQSQPVQLEEWTVAFQLVAEVLDERGLQLPPAKRAEVTLLAHDLLIEGMQRAKVLRFVQAAAA